MVKIQRQVSHSDLKSIMDCIFNPSSVAVVGASSDSKKEMRAASSAASAMASAWEAAYLDYEALRNPSNIVAGSDIVKVEAKRERTKELFTKFDKSLRRAWKEEKEFLKRLKLSGDEGQRILNDASRATAADEWLQKLENEIGD